MCVHLSNLFLNLEWWLTNLCVFIKHYDISKPVCGNWIYIQMESKQTFFYVPWTVKDGTRQYVWPTLRCGFAGGHRVALVVHRALKYVPDSAGEWPTFPPLPLESCSGTANVDGPNCQRAKWAVRPLVWYLFEGVHWSSNVKCVLIHVLMHS